MVRALPCCAKCRANHLIARRAIVACCVLLVNGHGHPRWFEQELIQDIDKQ
jgi:hypothetical protein